MSRLLISAAERRTGSQTTTSQHSALTNAPKQPLNCCRLKVIKMKMRLEIPFSVLVNNISRLVSSHSSSLDKEVLCQPNRNRPIK